MSIFEAGSSPAVQTNLKTVGVMKELLVRPDTLNDVEFEKISIEDLVNIKRYTALVPISKSIGERCSHEQDDSVAKNNFRKLRSSA